MGLFIISKRDGGEEVRRMKSLLKETKENIHELCEMVDRAEIEMQDRAGYREGGEYREPDRVAYRDDRGYPRERIVYRDEYDHYGERRR